MSRSRPAGVVVSFALVSLACAACSDEPEALIDVVVSEAAPGLPERPDRLTLVVTWRDAAGDHDVLSSAIDLPAGAPAIEPWATRVRPATASHAGQVVYRFVVVAERNGVAYVTKEQRLVFVPGTRLVLPIRLEAECVEQQCDPDLTCGGGLCASTYVSACTLVSNGRPTFCENAGTDEPIVVPLVGGHNHACAGKADGSVWCWGLNSAGQLGDLRSDHGLCGPSLDCSTPVAVRSVSGVRTLAAGALHMCARSVEGLVQCWGDGTYGALGDGVATHGTCDDTRVADCSRAARDVTGLEQIVQIASGLGHTCALGRDGVVRCWGLDDRGQLGEGTGSADICGGSIDSRSCSRAPVVVADLEGVSSIAAGRKHTCALREGAVFCWGDDSTGQLGDGDAPRERCAGEGLPCAERPVAVTGIADAIALGGGSAHTCALLADRTVRCWGSNVDGRLGTGEIGGQSDVPVEVVGLADVVQIAVADESACARLADATVRCWGTNERGQLGDGSITGSSASPVVVENLADATDIAAGERFVCARVADGDVWCWGENGGRQLGDGTTTGRLGPVRVEW